MIKWARSDSYFILEKNLNLFCPYPENLSETELRSDGLICLTEEISWQVWWFE